VAEVVDLDQAEDGTPYIAMEYVEGPDLGQALARGLPPVARALGIARGVALGLGAAHAKGIVHRDVKPGNILLAGRKGSLETPKLLDFGIAAVKQSATTLGGTQGLSLTPHYASPEQWRGMTSGEVDGRADLYALGGVLYQMLTGETCFHAQNTEGWMYQHLHVAAQAPSRLKPALTNWRGLDALVLRLLAKERESRPKDAAEVVALIDAVLTTAQEAKQETVRMASLPPLQPAVLPQQQRVSWRMWAFVAGVIAIAVVGTVMFIPQHAQPGIAAPTAPPQTLTQAPAVASGKAPESTEAGPTQAAALHPVTNQGAPAQDVKPGGFETPKTQDNTAELIEQVADAMAPTVRKTSPSGSLSGTEQQAEGLFQEKRYSEAKPLFDQTCSSSNADGCFYLGRMFGEGLGVTLDYARAASFYSKACDAGSYKGCNNLGTFYNKGLGVAQDYARAASLFDRVCDAHTGKACSNLADMYAQGQGVTRDDSRAADLYAKGCDGGESNACGKLGLMLTEGHGVFQDIPRAAGLFQKACDAGNAMGCNDLGILYVNGNGIARDPARAVTLFTQSCDGGADWGCHNLAKMYLNGNGVAKDDSHAATLYAKSCYQGNADACLQVGLLYGLGDGVVRSKDSAMQYFRKACSLGSQIACGNVKTLQ
jgi:TPR repeat protein